MDFFQLLPLLISSAGTIKSLVDTANSNEDLITKLDKGLPHLGEILTTIGGSLFPKVKDELRMAAGAMAAFDPDITKWVQGSLNEILGTSLAVDGVYGPRTRAAVEQLQEQLGLEADGWAGSLTRNAIEQYLSSKPVLKG